MAKGYRCIDDHDVEVAKMATAKNVLAVYFCTGKPGEIERLMSGLERGCPEMYHL